MVTNYKTFMDLIYLSPRFSTDVATPNFTTLRDNKSDESFKEELLLYPIYYKVSLFTIVFKTKTNFPSFINHFLSVIVSV